MKANCVLAILAVMALLLVAGCGIGEITLSPENAENASADEGAEAPAETTDVTGPAAGTPTNATGPVNGNTTGSGATNTTPVERAESKTGDFIAVLQAANVDSDLLALNLTIKAVEVQDEKNSWKKVSLSSTDVNVAGLSGTTGREIALNTLPTGIHKAIRLTFATSGKIIGENATTYTIPYQYIVADKPFTLMPDETLVFVFVMDVAKSVVTSASGTTMVKPQGTLKLLRGAITRRESGGLMDVTGGVEVYSITEDYDGLLPAGATADIAKQCNSTCTATCSGSGASCVTDCKAAVKKGCELGEDECRDYCDPYISPWICRDSCGASTSTCQHDLYLACSDECAGTDITPCVNDCVKACTG